MLDTVTIIAQVAVAISVAFVWILRMHNVKKEFEQFGLSITIRSFVGFSKTVLATLLIVGIWYPEFTLYASVGMAFFMLAAQYFQWSAGNPLQQKLPSFLLLMLSIFIAISSLDTI